MKTGRPQDLCPGCRASRCDVYLKAATIVAGNSIFTEFKGALTEQYVLQQLILRYEPYYYAKTNSTQEIDFLLQDEEDEIVPLEVKAETNVRQRACASLLQTTSQEGLSHLHE